MSVSRARRAPPTRRTLAIRTYIWFGLILAMLLLLVTFAAVAFNRLGAASERNMQSYRLLDEAERLQSAVVTMQTGYRGYMLTGDTLFLQPLLQSIPAADLHSQRLREMTRDEAAYQERLRVLDRLRLEWTDEFMEPRLRMRSEIDEANVTIDELEQSIDAVRGKAYVTEIRGLLAGIRAAEEARLAEREATTRRLGSITRLALTLGGLFAIIVTALLAGLAVRSSSRTWTVNERLRREIAVRKEAEHRLGNLSRRNELILNTAADGIWGVDRRGVTTFMNDAAGRMIGVSADELIGLKTHALVHHSYPDGSPYPEEECRIRAAILDGRSVTVADEVFWRPDGSSFPVEYSATPLTEDDEIRGAVVVFRDVTERREVDRMKDEFVSVVSHELRTPLTSIRGSLGLLSSGLLGTLPERGQRLLEIASENTDRLVRLVNDILDIEKMDAGKLEMLREAEDVDHLIQQAVNTVESMATRLSVSLEVEAPRARVWVDVDRIVQVLTNLMSNAVKFSEPGGVVKVRGETVEGQLRLSVQDHGRGIPLEMQERIFGRFQQVDASDSRQKGGTGLGLAIVRSIIQQHGGRVWVESEPGEGSTFHFTIPLLAEGEPKEDPREPAHDAPLVLLCDDDESIRQIVGAQLEQEGYRIVVAEDGQSALEVARAQQPEAILLDLMMPGVDGWETLERLKAEPATRDIPVIIFSARSPETGERGGAVDWVTKSSGDATLFEALQRALSARERPARILIVEENDELAGVLRSFFERSGLETVHARSCEEALRLSADRLPDLLVLDLVQTGCAVDAVNCLRRDPRLRRVPLVVYSASDVMAENRNRLGAGARVLSHDITDDLGLEERLTRVLGHLLNHHNPDSDAEEDPDRR